jgi:hypothetical protein
MTEAVPSDQAGTATAAGGTVAAAQWQSRRLFPLLAVVVPAFVAVTILEGVGPDADPLSGAELARLTSALTTDTAPSGTIAIAAVLAVHVCACLAGIVVVAMNLLGESPPPREHARRLSLVGFALAVATLAAIALSGNLAAYKLTFGWLFTFFGSAPVNNVLRMMMWLPIGLGVFGLAMIAAAGNADLGWQRPAAGARDEAYETKLVSLNLRFKQYLYILSLGLVASTVAVSLFLSLPSKMVQGDLWPGRTLLEEKVEQQRVAAATNQPQIETLDVQELKRQVETADLAAKAQSHQLAELTAFRGRLDTFASELSLFWGGVFALTLIAAIGLPIIGLQRQAQIYLERIHGEAAALAASKRLGEAGLLAQGFDKLKLLVALLAPLATGSLAGFVQSAAP